MSVQWLEKLYLSEELSDVTFVVEDEAIPAHRIILAANCDYFKTMLFGKTSEAGKAKITLKETPLKQFREVIRAIYLRKVDLSDWNADEVICLLGLAHEYRFSILAETAVSTLQQALFTPETVAKFFEIAKIYDLQSLADRCFDYTDNNSEVVFGNVEAFRHYSASFMTKIVERSTLFEKEVNILKAVWKWQQDRPMNERRMALSKIRWEWLSHQHCYNFINLLLTHSDDALDIADWYNKLQPPSKRRKNALNICDIKSVHNSLDDSLLAPPYDYLLTTEFEKLFFVGGPCHSRSEATVTITLNRSIEANEIVFNAPKGTIKKTTIDSSWLTTSVKNSDCPPHYETYVAAFHEKGVIKIGIHYRSSTDVRINGLRLFISTDE